MRLLLDEMIGPRVADELRRRGFDVKAVVEDSDLRGLPDTEVLAEADAEQRVLVTRNVADFSVIHQHWARDGRTHSGIVLVTQKQFPQSRNLVGALVAALVAARDDDLLPAANDVLFLGPAAPLQA